jgi:hypothetical protein
MWEQGYIEVVKFDSQDCWDLCNWSCYQDIKPENLHSDIEVANSDIIFHNPKTNKYHLALPSGWKVLKSLDEVKTFCENKQGKLI